MEASKVYYTNLRTTMKSAASKARKTDQAAGIEILILTGATPHQDAFRRTWKPGIFVPIMQKLWSISSVKG